MIERIKWIDVAKFLGIFAIYLGHFEESAGNAYIFVYRYHVPLFFLISGCMSNYNQENNLKKFVVTKIKNIMIPFWIFSLFSIVLNMIYRDRGLSGLKQMLITVAKGNMRLTFVAGSLWFLSCLFLMEIIFQLFVKYLKNKYLILSVCLVMYMFINQVLPLHFDVGRQWLYNLDQVFNYIIYFAIGYIVYPYIVELFKLDTRKKRMIFICTGMFSLAYSVLLFVGKDYVGDRLSQILCLNILIRMIETLIIIWLNFVVAKLLEKNSICNELGKMTLYLCGSEYIIKTLVDTSVSLLGLRISLLTPLHVYIYVMVLLIVCAKGLVPVEKKVVKQGILIFEQMTSRI